MEDEERELRRRPYRRGVEVRQAGGGERSGGERGACGREPHLQICIRIYGACAVVADYEAAELGAVAREKGCAGREDEMGDLGEEKEMCWGW